MCEWLLCREWCDVQLQCGGHSFGAHRAVLASVSSFLRRLLLSCPTEETPTFIVLPDFDLEAMSSVLYYIYNGEVVLQKQKFEMFMEIVKAMQIFVDQENLRNMYVEKEDIFLYSSNPDKIEKSKIYSLGSNNDETFINLKKGDHIQDILEKHCIYLDLQDKPVRLHDVGTRACFGNVQSTHEHRQRGFFLRDLFIETYPRNGNANGRTEGVLAMPNERYREAASVLLTNANGNHLTVDDAFADRKKKTNDIPQWSTLIYPAKQQLCSLNSNDEISVIDCNELARINSINTRYFNPKLLLDSCNNSRTNLKHLWMNRLASPQSPTLSTVFHDEIEKPYLDFSNDNSIQRTRKSINIIPYDTESSNLQDKRYYSNKYKSASNSPNVLSRNTILNQVLESPWSPRQPSNYRPFRRKIQSTPNVLPCNAKDNTVNDDNNNVQTSPMSTIIPTHVTVDPLSSTTGFLPRTDFKCTICNQVFPDGDGLALHSRRHSSPARYSCTECSKSFSQLRNFKYHMSVHRGTREFAATCAVCGKYFNDRGYLSSHMKIHRNRKEYKCSQCPKSFNQRVAYNMHVRIHTGIKPHVCGECGKAFSRKMLLKQHQRTHSGERPYACSHCDKRFADRSNMTLHLRLHSGIKPFSCSLCPKSFTKKHHLKSHLNFHTGAKPYSCPRCKLAFTQSSNMRTHFKKCTAPMQTNNALTSASN